MKKLEESRILAMAPNASAISNAKKLCDKGAFLKLWRSVDDTLYMGECKGSGKSNYTVSVDFIDEENPVTRCTCPSRQFPCKHGLALLFEILRGKKFEECEIPEDILARLLLEIQAYKEDQDKGHYQTALECLKKLRAIEKKGREFLNEQLEKNDPELTDNTLYEDLGGVWKLTQLNDLGLKKENARLVQLSFEVNYDEASKIFTDCGYWIDLESGEVSYTANYRPRSAMKYIKQENSNFSLLTVPTLTFYPGGVNKRIRWDAASFDKIESSCYKEIKKHAQNIDHAVKIAKNELKNILTNNEVALLLEFEKIMFVEEEGKKKYILIDKNQKMIELRDKKSKEFSENFYELLPNECLENQVMFVKLFYEGRNIYAQAQSIITDDKIIRFGF